MTRFLGGILEGIHVLAVALLFGAAALLMSLAAPAWLPEAFVADASGAGRVFKDLAPLVGSPGRVLAVIALVAAVLAPYVRNDPKKAAAWVRIVLAGAALIVLLSGWGPEGTSGWGGKRGVSNADVETHATATEKLKIKAARTVTPWTALALITGLSLSVGAFQLNGGGGGGAKKG